jgi:hypothetical protein
VFAFERDKSTQQNKKKIFSYVSFMAIVASRWIFVCKTNEIKPELIYCAVKIWALKCSSEQSAGTSLAKNLHTGTCSREQNAGTNGAGSNGAGTSGARTAVHGMWQGTEVRERL